MKIKRLISCITAISLIVAAIAIKPTHSKAADDANFLNTYGSYFGKIGTCVKLNDLQNKETLDYVKKHYNSITLDNEMKPDGILGGEIHTISRDEAIRRGYYIPDNYSENAFPALNFGTIDRALEICFNNGLSFRAHTLVWHDQTPEGFYRQGFNADGEYVSKDVMNARLEFYVKSVFNHVHKSRYKSCVYAWDVVNEQLESHRPLDYAWTNIYGKGSDKYAYVKNAFRYAYEARAELGLASEVKLFYNEYNTYWDSVTDEIIKLLDYINSGVKYCDGLGMQTHLNLRGKTDPTVEKYIECLKRFLNEGYEIQITEMDIMNYDNDTLLSEYVHDFFTELLKVKMDGGNITAIVWWGLSDPESWRADKYPLLFSKRDKPKKAYYSALQAYEEVVGDVGHTPPPVVIVTPEPKTSPTPIPLRLAADADAEVKYTKTDIAINGVAESEWDQTSYIPVKYYSVHETDTTVKAKLLWNESYLFGLVDVKDAAIDKTSQNPYERDGIEIFFDEDNCKEASYGSNRDAFQFRYTGLSDDGSDALTRSFASTGQISKIYYSGLADKIQYSVTPDGYLIEFAIPLREQPIINKSVGFELTVMDCQNGARRNEIWMLGKGKANMYQNPGIFGTLRFVEELSPTASPVPTYTPTPAVATETPDISSTEEPTVEPVESTEEPTVEPTSVPTQIPTRAPVVDAEPTSVPIVKPSNIPVSEIEIEKNAISSVVVTPKPDVTSVSEGDLSIVNLTPVLYSELLEQKNETVIQKQEQINTVISAPEKLVVIIRGNSKKVLVKWNAVSDADKYRVYRSTKKNGKYKLLKTVKKCSYNDKTEKSKVKYFYKITALKNVDNTLLSSDYSKTVKVKIK